MDGRKKYYSITEVSEMLSLADSVLRHWESEFPQLHPRKSRSGKRQYMKNDIEILKKIAYLMYEEKYTTEGSKNRLAQIKSISLERYKNLTYLVYEPSFWKELETIAELL